MVKAPTKKTEDMKESYHVKVAIALGVLHIICGIVAFASEIVLIIQPQSYMWYAMYPTSTTTKESRPQSSSSSLEEREVEEGIWWLPP